MECSAPLGPSACVGWNKSLFVDFWRAAHWYVQVLVYFFQESRD